MHEATIQVPVVDIANGLDASAEHLEEIFNLPAFEGPIPYVIAEDFEANSSLQVSEEAKPLVLNVSEMAEDKIARAEAAHLIGEVLVNHEVQFEAPSIEKPIYSLCEAIHLAGDGDAEALRLVEANATTDIAERSIVTGVVMDPVKLKITPENEIVQNGQPLTIIQANSLKAMNDHPVMGPRTRAETTNTSRIKVYNQEGYFDKGYVMVFCSLAEDLPEAGFFTKTMSCAIQVISKTDVDELELETAFVSGRKSPSASRHDLQTIKGAYEALGQEVSNEMPPSQIPTKVLNKPLLIHKDLIPNGVIDLVKIWDDCAGGTFFGQDKPRQDYLQYREECRRKQQEFVPIGKQIAADLIAERDQILTPLAAVQKLNKISAQYAVAFAINDPSINADVFGEVAAEHIMAARQHLAEGNLALAEREADIAAMTEASASCPSILGVNSDSLSQEDAGDGKGSLYFACPKCHKINKRPFGGYLDRCTHCKTTDVSCRK